MRQTGKCKMFNKPRGFGFLLVATGDEYFVHCSDLELDRDYLDPDEKVTFELATGDDGRKRATDVRLVQAEADQAIGWIQP